MNVKKIFLTVGASLVVSVASAQSYAIDWHAIGAGGTSTGGVYSVSATIGEVAAGQMSGGNYTMDSGFWVAAAPELIVNGSFENTGNTFVADVYGLMSLPAASTNIPGWTTTTAELAWVNNMNTFGAATPFGAQSLELTGYHDGPPYAGVTQTTSTTPGQNYRLTLSLGSNADYPGAGGQKSVSVCASSVCTNLTFIPTNTSGNQWGLVAFNFTANSTSTVVTITGLVASGIYLGLDNVSVMPDFATPVSPPRIIAVEKLGSDLRLSFTSATGKNYAIQSRATVESGEWTTLVGTTNAGTGGMVQTTVTNALTQPQQCYRVWQLP